MWRLIFGGGASVLWALLSKCQPAPCQAGTARLAMPHLHCQVIYVYCPVLPCSVHAVHHWAARGQRHHAAGQPEPRGSGGQVGGEWVLRAGRRVGAWENVKGRMYRGLVLHAFTSCMPLARPAMLSSCPHHALSSCFPAAASAWRAARRRGSAPRRPATSTRACPAWAMSSRWVRASGWVGGWVGGWACGLAGGWVGGAWWASGRMCGQL